jgi:hypothetical protein
VHLVDQDEVVRADAECVCDATAILGDVRWVVADVERKVERLVGSLADASEAVGHDRVDAPLAKVRGAVDAKWATLLDFEL